MKNSCIRIILLLAIIYPETCWSTPSTFDTTEGKHTTSALHLRLITALFGLQRVLSSASLLHVIRLDFKILILKSSCNICNILEYTVPKSAHIIWVCLKHPLVKDNIYIYIIIYSPSSCHFFCIRFSDKPIWTYSIFNDGSLGSPWAVPQIEVTAATLAIDGLCLGDWSMEALPNNAKNAAEVGSWLGVLTPQKHTGQIQVYTIYGILNIKL